MLFKKRNEKQKTSDVKKRAERYVSIASEATKLLQNDIANIPDDISGKDIESMFVSLIMLLVASFAADVDGCLEMMPTYQQRLLLEGISESEYNRQTELIQDRYSAFRAKAIESQQSADNWKPVFVKYMTELIMNYMGLCGANNEMSNKIDALVRNISARINPNIGL